MKPYRCGSCQYKATDLNAFIVHFRTYHPTDIVAILKPVQRGDRWKYSCFNYGVVVDYVGSILSFRVVMRLVSLGDRPESTPDVKRKKLVSLLGDDLNDTIPFEN